MYLKKPTEKQASSGLKWVLCGSFWITIIWPCTVDGDSSRTEQRCCDSSVSFFSSSPWGCCICFFHLLYCAVRSFLMCLFFFSMASEQQKDAPTYKHPNRRTVPSLLRLLGVFLQASSQQALTAVMRRCRKHTMYSGGHSAVGCCSETQTHEIRTTALRLFEPQRQLVFTPLLLAFSCRNFLNLLRKMYREASPCRMKTDMKVFWP